MRKRLPFLAPQKRRQERQGYGHSLLEGGWESECFAASPLQPARGGVPVSGGKVTGDCSARTDSLTIAPERSTISRSNSILPPPTGTVKRPVIQLLTFERQNPRFLVRLCTHQASITRFDDKGRSVDSIERPSSLSLVKRATAVLRIYMRIRGAAKLLHELGLSTKSRDRVRLSLSKCRCNQISVSQTLRWWTEPTRNRAGRALSRMRSSA